MKIYDFMGKRKIFLAVSCLIILIGIISTISKGFILDIQYTGGTQFIFEMNDAKFTVTEAEDIVEGITGNLVTGQTIHPLSAEDPNVKLNVLMLKVATQGKEPLSNEKTQEVIKAMNEKYNLVQSPEIKNVDPTIGDELFRNALMSLILAFGLIVIYIAIRFKVMSGFMSALFAIIALISAMTVMITVYTVFNIPVNDSLIAALLTIIGYSLNDTIILYDRIRENVNTLSKLPVYEVINKSISQTLNRTLNTSLTTIAAIASVYVLASIYEISSLKDFSFPLMIGIIAGTYSSIFIALPLWGMWKNNQNKNKKIVSRKSARA